MKQGITFCILIMLLLSSCKYHNYSINDLEKKEISFDSLPGEVKGFYERAKEFLLNKEIPPLEKYDFSGTRLVDLDTIREYRFETIPTIIGPWISHYKLIDKTNGISYRIDFGIAFPIIIFNGLLFIPQEYNTLSEDDFYGLYFNCYYLDR
jgi:hypothetical protein